MTKRILICDDEVHILRAAEIKFSRAGFEVHCAFDGEEAWSKVIGLIPDIVITDCQMPRLNGIGLAERIHNDPLTCRIPVLMLTGKGYELSRRELQQKYNIIDVLNKPFSPRDLLQRVEKLLHDFSGSPSTGDAARESFATTRPIGAAN